MLLPTRRGVLFVALQALLLIVLLARYFGGGGEAGVDVGAGSHPADRLVGQRIQRQQQQQGRQVPRTQLTPMDSAAGKAGPVPQVGQGPVPLRTSAAAERRRVMAGAAASVRLPRREAPTDPLAGYSVPVMAPAPVAGEQRKFLMYQPQFGMGNQLLALKSAVAMARTLDRWLVVPHYQSNNGRGKYVPYGALFDLEVFQTHVPKSITMDDFLELGLRPRRLFDMALPLQTVHQHFDYFTDLQVFGEGAHALNASISTVDDNGVEHHIKLTDEDLLRKYGAMDDQVLAFSTTYKMFSHFIDRMLQKEVSDSWSVSVIPARRVREAANAAVERLRAPTSAEGTAEDGKFACGHVRRTDFTELCNVSDSAWLASLSSQGYLCWPSMEEIVSELNEVSGTRVFVATDSPGEIRKEMGLEASFELAFGEDFTHLLAGGPSDPALPLMEVEICSLADTLVVNRYSTFSLFMAHSRHIKEPKTKTDFWMREDVRAKVQDAKRNHMRKQAEKEAAAKAQEEGNLRR